MDYTTSILQSKSITQASKTTGGAMSILHQDSQLNHLTNHSMSSKHNSCYT